MRPSRNASTAISLAALSTVLALPPAASTSRQAERREAGLVRRLEGECADGREIEPRGRRLHAIGPGKAVGDRRAHVGGELICARTEPSR